MKVLQKQSDIFDTDKISMELDNNTMTVTSFDENNSTKSLNYSHSSQNNNQDQTSLDLVKEVINNFSDNNKLESCNFTYESNTNHTNDFFYAFNIIPINLNFLSGQQDFSFLSELNRGIEICEMNQKNKTVHIQYQNIFYSSEQFDFPNNSKKYEQKYSSLIDKLKQSINFFQQFNNQMKYDKIQQMSFNERSKDVVNKYFQSKQEKRLFALSSSYDSTSQQQQFSVHFSPQMINTLGYDSNSFMLKCSITGLNEFMMKNDFIQNMEIIIVGLSNQITKSDQFEQIKIKQKFIKNQDEAMEAMFSVYMLQDPSLIKESESIIVFEILHILDFQVQTKGKKYVSKQRQLDINESFFLERYLKLINLKQNINQYSESNIDETSEDIQIDKNHLQQKNIHNRRKQISKQSKNTNIKIQKRRRILKDFISY